MSENKNEFVVSSRLVDENNLSNRLINIFTKWEVLLAVIFVLMMIVFSSLSPKFLVLKNLLNFTGTFSEKAILALPMIFIIMCGDIDISIASIMVLSSTMMGLASEDMGASTIVIILIGLATGAVCGLINGVLITSLNMPAIAVTLATQSIYRGISKGILQERAITKFPDAFYWFGQGKIGLAPAQLIVFLVLAAIMYVLLHHTVYGRRLYAIGSSPEAARFAGVPVKKQKITNYLILGIFCGIAGMILAARMSSVKYANAQNYDMEAITLVVLGGVSISGGKGTVYGVVISAFLVGFMRFGLTLMHITGTQQVISIGFLLIIAVLLPRLLDMYKANRKLAKQQAQARLAEALGK